MSLQWYIHIITLFTWYYARITMEIIGVTRIACKIATNWPNSMIFISMESRESELENDGTIINFGWKDEKL